MAVKNRTEILSRVTAVFAPTLTLPSHKGFFSDDFVNSCVLRKDIIASETPAGGAVAVDYSSKDLATVATAVNTSISFTGLENGDVKYLEITKQAANTLTFAGATNVTLYQAFIDIQATLITYEIFNKNGNIYVRAMFETIIKGNLSNIQAADDFKFPSCKAVNEAIAADLPQFVDIPLPAWDMLSDEFCPFIAMPAVVTTNKLRVSGSTVFILEDGALFGYPLLNPPDSISNNGSWYLDFAGGQIVLKRLNGGYFVSASFDSLGQSRGNIRIFFTTV